VVEIQFKSLSNKVYSVRMSLQHGVSGGQFSMDGARTVQYRYSTVVMRFQLKCVLDLKKINFCYQSLRALQYVRTDYLRRTSKFQPMFTLYCTYIMILSPVHMEIEGVSGVALLQYYGVRCLVSDVWCHKSQHDVILTTSPRISFISSTNYGVR
jgi:hypothetical protein